MQDKHRQADEALLASLGYKQEFRREFAPLEVFGIAFSIIGLLPSIASVLVYALPNGGPVSMVWGWVVASLGVLLVGISMAELASAAPTSGGVMSFLSAARETTPLRGLSSSALLLDTFLIFPTLQKSISVDRGL
jgi:amino acid transporter